MNVTALPSALKASEQPIERLAANSHLSETDKIAEASRQFEAVLLRQILQQARKTVFDSEFNSENTTSSIYQDMVTDQLAESISRSGTFGLARSLQMQLTRQTAAEAAVSRNETPAAGADATLTPGKRND